MKNTYKIGQEVLLKWGDKQIIVKYLGNGIGLKSFHRIMFLGWNCGIIEVQENQISNI